MPQNEADRIAKARIEGQKRQEEETRRAVLAQQQVDARRFQAEIPIVLRWLAGHNYPGMEVLRVWSNNPIMGLFGILETKGGWRIGVRKTNGPRDDKSYTPIYLLSDGHMCITTVPDSQYNRSMLSNGLHGQEYLEVLKGLRNVCPELPTLNVS